MNIFFIFTYPIPVACFNLLWLFLVLSWNLLEYYKKVRINCDLIHRRVVITSTSDNWKFLESSFHLWSELFLRQVEGIFLWNLWCCRNISNDWSRCNYIEGQNSLSIWNWWRYSLQRSFSITWDRTSVVLLNIKWSAYPWN